jgi:hypothetical protein
LEEAAPVAEASTSGTKRSASDAGVSEVDAKVFKRIREVEVSSREDTLTFWKGNKLFIVEH